MLELLIKRGSLSPLKKLRGLKDNCCKSKNAKKLACSSACASALFHFIFCGLPMLITITSTLMGATAVLPQFIFINHQVKTYMLAVTGILLVVSFVMQSGIKGSNILMAALILYMLSATMHFTPMLLTDNIEQQEIYCH